MENIETNNIELTDKTITDEEDEELEAMKLFNLEDDKKWKKKMKK